MSQKLKDLHAARKVITKELAANYKAGAKINAAYKKAVDKNPYAPELGELYKKSVANTGEAHKLCDKISTISDKIDDEIVRIVLKLSAGK